MPNIISDIAGNYHTLLALLKKMPDDEPISIGDMVDRGPKSKEVINFFRQNGKAILGNHEHMMIDCLSDGGYYDRGLWLYNGGGKTIESFEYHVPDEIYSWIKRLPLFLEINNILISHSFVHPNFSLKDACDLKSSIHEASETLLWNRTPPARRSQWKLQIAGHNSQIGLKKFEDNAGLYALCIDDSRKKILTGVNTDTLEIFQQEYIDV